MMKNFFLELFNYTYHFNQELNKQFFDHQEHVSEKAWKLYFHTLSSHHIWNGRILGQPSPYQVWETFELKECAAIASLNYHNSLLILDTQNLDTVIQYQTSTGESFSNILRDVLFHINNHSTYHRAQIATEFKAHGIKPLVSDYAIYKR